MLRTLIDGLPDYIFIKDRQSRFLVNNLAHARVLGAAHPNEVAGKTDLDIFPAELAKQYYADEQALMKSGQPLNREERVVDPKTGETRWLQTTKTPLKDQAGKVVGLMGISRDITERKRAEESMATAHRLLQAILDNLPDRVYFKDAQSRFVQCNQAVARRVGVEDVKQVIGKTDFDFYSREKAGEFRRDEQKIMQAGQPLLNKAEQVIKPDGEVTWASVTKVPLRDQAGRVMGLVGISRDITELKRTEAALRQSRDELEQRVAGRTAELSARNAELTQANEARVQAQRLLQAMLDNVPDRIYFKDTQSRFLRLSKALAKRLGLEKPDQAVGKTDFDFIARERAGEFFEDEQRIIRTGEPLINKIERQVLSNGETAWTSTTKMPLRDQDGKVMGIMGINRDVTEQKRTEEALQQARKGLEQRVTERTAELSARMAELTQANEARVQAQRLLQALLDNIPDWIYFKDAQFRFLKCSKTHAQRLRVEPDQVVGKTDFDFHPTEVAEVFHRDELKIIQTGKPLINKVEKKRKPNGEAMWTSTTKVPMRDERGTIVGIVGVNRDITERIQAEESLRHSHDELEQRVAERTAELFRAEHGAATTSRQAGAGGNGAGQRPAAVAGDAGQCARPDLFQRHPIAFPQAQPGAGPAHGGGGSGSGHR